ncbi:MAG: sigma-70 family RNA polymerase sigma factor [Deltaproteobacteria bacterium]|nr:sigma-70 family RNA polymerase sigma factor [Deltaproteobacteria bacterium]
MDTVSTLDIAAAFTDHAPFIGRTIARLTGTGSHVDDLLQETFIVAFKKRNTYDPSRAELSTWLYGIAANLCRRHARGENRFGNFRKKLSAETPAAKVTDTPEQVFERNRELQMVQDAINRLPFKQREAFVLFEIEGMDGAQISRLLNVKEGTIWTRIHHGRKRFMEYCQTRGRFNE